VTWAPTCKAAPGKKGTRLIKLTAACCGCTTRKWVDLRNPLCPHGQPMAEE
jgi:hypothetical protein